MPSNGSDASTCTPTQTLLDELRALGEEAVAVPRVGADGALTHLFVSWRDKVAMLQRWGDVLPMDCTYKTNRYSLPLLEVTGITATMATFTAAVVFISGETEPDYAWALAQLARLLPPGSPLVVLTDKDQALMAALVAAFPDAANLLCRWHVNNNVNAQVRSLIRDGDAATAFLRLYTQVCNSTSPADYELALQTLGAGGPTPPDGHMHAGASGWTEAVAYLMQTWMVHHEKIVGAWVHRHRHLGNTATSRVEGAHATLKAMLRHSTGDLARVAHDVHALMHRQATESAAAEAREAVRTPAEARSASVLAPANDRHGDFTVRDLLFALVSPYTRVGHATLRTILEEVAKARRPGDLPPCTRYHATVLGVPCAHTVRDHIAARRPLPLALVAERWHLRLTLTPAPTMPPAGDQLPVPPMVRDPNVVRARGRPAGGRDTSTRRDPSAFERTDGDGNARRSNVCGKCGQTGHNVRTCPSRDRQAVESSQSGSAGGASQAVASM